MARIVFPSDLQRYTGGVAQAEVAAANYRELLVELRQRFPALTQEMLRKQALAIDGMIVPEPLLQTFREDSELVLFPKMAGG